MLVLHEGEPGAAAFVDGNGCEERARHAASPSRRPRPLRVRAARRPPDPPAPRRPPHPPRARGPVRPPGWLARARCRCASAPSTASTSSALAAGSRVADRAVGRLARRQIAISRGLADYLAEVEGFDADAFDVVHYGIAAGPEPLPYEGKSARLLAIGRLIPIKGLDVLLEAFALARARIPSLTLEIAGDGALREQLEAMAGDGVTFLGRVDPIGPAIERAAVVVVPSRGEGFGMVALEAMERGRAVIASTVGGLPELVVPGETGVLVPVESVDALAEAIVELCSDLDRARALGVNGRTRALNVFGEEQPVASIEAIYRAALAR